MSPLPMNTTHAHALEIAGGWGLDHLQHVTRPLRPPQAGEVLVRLKATSLNYRDLMMVRGQYNPRQPLPLIPCSDGVGEVIAVGEGVRLKVGARVATLFSQEWASGEPRDVTQSTLGGPLDGTLTTHITLREEGLVPVPSYLTDLEAGTLSCAALTAWSALVELGQLKGGERVLCIGTGGVSLFAAQIARALGAEVYLISRSEEKLARAAAHVHPHHLIHTPTSNTLSWGKEVRRLSGGGVDHVVEVGGAQTLAQSLQAVRAGGTVSLIGVLSGSGADPALSLLPILMRQLKVQGVIVGHREGFERMLRAFELHHIRPLISHTFALSEARQAFEVMARAEHVGKVAIEL